MSSTVQPSKRLGESLQALHSLTNQYSEIINGLIAIAVGHDAAKVIRKEDSVIPASMGRVLAILMQAAGASTHTLLKLSEMPGLHTRDCYSISRSILETAVNICYIMAEGEPAAARAIRHANQKSYQDLERQSEIGSNMISLVYQGRPDASTLEGLEAEIAEFTSRTNREKGWVDLSVDQRIAVVGQRLGGSILTDLHFGRFMLYRHSSEILHGTYFSALFFFGASRPNGVPQTMEEFADFICDQHLGILFAVVVTLSAVVEAFHRAFGFQAAYDRSEIILKSLHDVPYFNNSSSNEAGKVT